MSVMVSPFSWSTVQSTGHDAPKRILWVNPPATCAEMFRCKSCNQPLHPSDRIPELLHKYLYQLIDNTDIQYSEKDRQPRITPA
jgi:hypothetical protein